MATSGHFAEHAAEATNDPLCSTFLSSTFCSNKQSTRFSGECIHFSTHRLEQDSMHYIEMVPLQVECTYHWLLIRRFSKLCSATKPVTSDSLTVSIRTYISTCEIEKYHECDGLRKHCRNGINRAQRRPTSELKLPHFPKPLFSSLSCISLIEKGGLA